MEYVLRKEKVDSSIPSSGTNEINNLASVRKTGAKIFGRPVLLFAQKCGEVFAQRIQPDIFGWDEHLVAG